MVRDQSISRAEETPKFADRSPAPRTAPRVGPSRKLRVQERHRFHIKQKGVKNVGRIASAASRAGSDKPRTVLLLRSESRWPQGLLVVLNINEYRRSQIRASEICSLEVRARQVGFSHYGILEIRTSKFGPGKINGS